MPYKSDAQRKAIWAKRNQHTTRIHFAKQLYYGKTKKPNIHPEDLRGLQAWVGDYVRVRGYGNTKLAKQIRDNVKKRMKEMKLTRQEQNYIWSTYKPYDVK